MALLSSRHLCPGNLESSELHSFVRLCSDVYKRQVHEDIEDEGQSVTVVEIGTTLVDAADGDHMVENGTVIVVDTVEYKGLVAGETYTAHRCV